MQFGYFDDQRGEYVITRPDTPRSWSNYLGTTQYGAIITNNAGGYSFYKSAAQGRFLRLRFNAVPMDQPGRYVYLRDYDSGDYWSTSWQPVGKPLDRYRSECRHGSAYTIITSDYAGIHTETTYFVPLACDYECWMVRVTNTGDRARRLGAFTYVEYASNWYAYNDLINLQYTQYIVKMAVQGNFIDHGVNVSIPAIPGVEDNGRARHTFLTVVGAPVVGYDTDREAFLGPYRGYANPLVVERGQTTNSIAVGDNGCGTLQVGLELAPGESRTFLVLLGVGEAAVEGVKAAAELSSPERAEEALAALKGYWHERIGGISVQTPDAELNSMLNKWAPFNCLMTYAWSRAASLVYAGERDGLGYRDTVQDMLGVLHAIPDEACARLELMLTGQVSTGGALPVVSTFNHRPGHEVPPREEEYRSDDCLWLFNAIQAYVKETGNLAFYHRLLPYADRGEDTVLGHMKRAIRFNLERSGAHGLPCGLAVDWNDCLRLGHKGESLFVAFQLRFALATYREVCGLLGIDHEQAWAAAELARLDDCIEQYGWDGAWYLRAYCEDGTKIGAAECDEGRIYMSPQAWALMSGHATPDRARQALDAVQRDLATEFGVMLCAPPYVNADPEVVRATLYNGGMKENASVFNHTQGWMVIAETLRANGNLAYAYFRAYLPAAYNARAEVREIEPYVYSQSTHSRYSPRQGASRLPWLTGTATWSYYAATQHILGLQPDYAGLRIDPCVPADWRSFTMRRVFRGKLLEIEVQNPDGVQKGVARVLLNGAVLPDNFVPAARLADCNRVLVRMGS